MKEDTKADSVLNTSKTFTEGKIRTVLTYINYGASCLVSSMCAPGSEYGGPKKRHIAKFERLHEAGTYICRNDIKSKTIMGGKLFVAMIMSSLHPTMIKARHNMRRLYPYRSHLLHYY